MISEKAICVAPGQGLAIIAAINITSAAKSVVVELASTDDRFRFAVEIERGALFASLQFREQHTRTTGFDMLDFVGFPMTLQAELVPSAEVAPTINRSFRLGLALTRIIANAPTKSRSRTVCCDLPPELPLGLSLGAAHDGSGQATMFFQSLGLFSNPTSQQYQRIVSYNLERSEHIGLLEFSTARMPSGT
ncbi:MAG TPA: hypothetical protein PKA88_09735 [Polyangiaceae bacterium]|nr:hypothetical protein [Polyangiaceae bacterium]HMR75096.1 hypothetical protein [Polyangiaceae bacterium]